jgi:2',3'-cyclic-nucleotide 2'-phosphodiesterase (5'-nucleotidase family)
LGSGDEEILSMRADKARDRSLLALVLGIATGFLLAGLWQVLSPQAEELTILHTNDIHGAYAARPAPWRDDGRPVGGFEALAYRVRQIRGERSVLLLDAGDLMTGHPVCDLEVDGVKGALLVDLMNRIGYDAMALGNHELDISQENALGLIRRAAFPVLCANLRREDGRLFTGRAATVVEVGGVRAGIIGVITEDLPGVVIKERIEGLRLSSAREAVQALADSLDPLTDLIVVLSHLGVREDRALARGLRGVDVIVGGHSHTRLRSPEKVGDVLIVQAGSRLTSLGRLDLEVRDDRVVNWRGELLDLWADEITPQPDIREILDRADRLLGDRFGRTLAWLAVPWERSSRQESNVGDWITDVLRRGTGADFAVINSGGIRKNLPAGPLRALDIYEILPFENEVCLFRVRGRQLLEILRNNARAQVEGQHGILQVSGLRYRFRTTPQGVEILEARVGEEPVDPEATYVGASVDFVVLSQAEKYFGFVPEGIERLGTRLRDLVLEAASRQDTIRSQGEGRILQVGR